MISCWLIWFNRNKCFHNQTCQVPSALARAVNRLKEDFLAVGDIQDMARLQSHQSWNPPSGNCFKLNVDAAFLTDSKKANLGMVVRDLSSTVQVCAMTKVDNIDSTLQVELRAIIFGLEIAQENLLTPLTVESDSLVAV